MAKRKNLNGIKQIDGEAVRVIPTTLDQLWGNKGEGVYHTADAKEYEDFINEMNLSDLQTHASKIGLLPTNNRDLLKSRLIREFGRHYAKYKIYDQAPVEKPISKELARLLAEGR